MGIESILGAAAAPVVGSVVGGLFGGKGSSQSGTQTQTTQQQMDPRIQSMLFGDGTDVNKGLLSQYQGYLNNPQSAGTANFGNQAQQLLGSQGNNILGQLQSGASGLLNSNISAPQAGSAQSAGLQNYTNAQVTPANGASVIWNKGAQVSAPSQNNTDLTGAYQNFISGQSGNNPYLNSALQAGVDATNAGFNKNVSTTTDALNSALGGIRGNSVLAGQYGSSRQGVAEGNALKGYTQQLTDANSLLAAQNSANTTAQQAASYNAGQDRALSATQGLGAQQYGVAGQNAANSQQAQLQNQSLANQTDQFNTSQLNNIGLNNAQLAQNNGQFNSTLGQNNNQFNANLWQNNNQFNAQQQSGTNALNSQNQQAGLAGLSGLLNNIYGYANNQDNAGINRATQVNGLLAPYLSANSSQTTTSPTYTNTGANILGGATAGLGLYNGIKNAFSSGNTAASTGGGYVPPWGLGGN